MIPRFGLAFVMIFDVIAFVFINVYGAEIYSVSLAVGFSSLFVTGCFIIYYIVLYSNRITRSILEEKRNDTNQVGELDTCYKIALDNTAMVSFSDLSGKIIYVNEMFCRVSGYDADDLIGQDHRILNSGKMKRDLFDQLWNYICLGQIWRGEICNRSKNNTLYWVDTTIVPVVETSGAVSKYISISRDITSVKQQQHELEAQKIRLEMALQDSGVGVWEWNIISNDLAWDDQMFAIYGSSRESFSSAYEAWAKGLHPEDSERAQFEISRAVQERKSFKSEFKVRRPDGSIAEVVARGRLICDSFGAPQRMIGINIDVTERNDLLRRVHQSNEWRRAVITAANVTMISTNPQGVIQTFNEKAEDFLGYRATEVIGRLTPAFIHDEKEVTARALELSRELGRLVAPGFEVFIAKAKLGIPDEQEWTYIRKDGSGFPIILSVSAIRSESGEITGYLGVGTDISERKGIEKKTRESERRLQYALEGSNDGLWDWDFIGKEMYLSETLASYLGESQNLAMTNVEQYAQRIHPDDKQKSLDLLKSHLENQTPIYEVEARWRKSSGEYAWVLTRGKISERDEKGHPIRMTGVHINVQGIKGVQERLKAAELKALEAVEAKSLFLASISHELRTPLNSIIGMADLTLKTQLTADQKYYIEILQQSGLSLLTIINDVLDFSKLEAGRVELSNDCFSVCSVVERQAEMMIGKAAEKGIALTTFISPDLPSKVLGDPERLGQILLNLMSNSIKFTSSGGVTVRAVEFQGRQRDPGVVWIRFEIEDSGIGISDENIGRLFQPFTQADASIGRKFGGTGLGLSISKRLVQAMSGDISIKSTVGLGSIFSFEVPFQVHISRDMSPIRDSVAGMNQVRAVVVDSDSFGSKTLRDYLSFWGMQCDVVSSLDQAVNQLNLRPKTENSHFVIFLGSMALDQFTEMKKLGSNCSFKLGEVILLQEFGARGSASSSTVGGFLAVLSKPIKQSSLFDILITCVVGKSRVREAKIESKYLVGPLRVRGSRILVADDVLANQILTRKLLEGLGYFVDVVSDGVEVLRVIQDEKYDLILMDCRMPEMDGFVASQKVRQLEEVWQTRIPIIALTANAMKGDEVLCLQSGMDDYLSKPIREEKLKAMLEKWLGDREIVEDEKTA